MEINIIPKFLDSALTPVAKEAGERLADIISLVFTPVIKVKAKRDKNIELFLKELEKEVDKIPENRIKEPSVHIIAPILEDVFKYYHEEDYLRCMFAKLIASAMDKNNTVHPSYVEVIKQISRYDIEVLRNFIILIELIAPETGYHFSYFSLEVYYQEGIFGWTSSIFMFAKGKEHYNVIEDQEKFISSLLNLERLALIRIKDNGIDTNKKLSDFGFKWVTDKKEEADKADSMLKIGSIEIIGTVYLRNIINVCMTKEFYELLDGNIIFR